MRIEGAVALVTGGSTGIGAATAERLVARGARVLVHGHLAAEVEETADRLGALGLVADFAKPEQRAALVSAALAAYGRVDILVANAGLGWSGPFTAMPPDHLHRVLDVNLVGHLELTRLLLPAMVERGSGSVCFVSSIAGCLGVAGEAVYAAAKAGLDLFAESLRLEAAGSGVDIGVVVPAAVRTGFFTARGRPYGRSLPRPVAPETIADAIVRVIERGRAESWVPRWLRVAAAARTLTPAGYRLLSRRFGEPIRL
ncbi:SDR family NAD(P)-dependent oxidoreductase [Nocardia sp. CDC160]|uniref:SDR family NAD(P)-dependent oxidoreductase n=1 Tax=Nocardia sp. CDC160 TaxID=3112166 RepID=UPI002DB77834|nr:SDR family NAD(P)-dependent oxidoreductase [Nocardia sp. CDC160]MEC3918357.1 SDR family NAD(P)-dependent oxidoreductase [Nocardia sp. CDC160]